MADNKKIASAIVQFLGRTATTAEARDSAEVACSVIRELYGITGNGDYTGPGLEALFAAPAATATATAAAVGSTTTEEEDVTATPLFQKYLATVKSRGVFKDYAPESKEYAAVFDKVVLKFKERMASRRPATAAAPAAAAAAAPAAPAAPVPAATPETEAQAEALKTEGNELIKAGDFIGAETKYTAALQACPASKNAHVFLCNRAAARAKQLKYYEAANDAREAVKLAPSYTKGHVRLGNALSAMHRYPEAIDAFEAALALDPANAAIVGYIDQAKAALSGGGATTAGGSTPGVPDFTQAAAAALQNPAEVVNKMQQALGDPNARNMLSNMMQNFGPAIRQMAGSMMGLQEGDPALEEMMKQASNITPEQVLGTMQNPEMMNMMQSMASTVGSQGGGPGGMDMASMMQGMAEAAATAQAEAAAEGIGQGAGAAGDPEDLEDPQDDDA